MVWVPWPNFPSLLPLYPPAHAFWPPLPFNVPRRPHPSDFALRIPFPIYSYSSSLHFLCTCHHCRKFFPNTCHSQSPNPTLFFFILFIIHIINLLFIILHMLPSPLDIHFVRAGTSSLLHLGLELSLANSRCSINICYGNVGNEHPGDLEIDTSYVGYFLCLHALGKLSSIGYLLCAS